MTKARSTDFLKKMPPVGVVGSGSFATANVKMLLENSETIHWLVRDEYTKGFIEQKGFNPEYLTAVEFNPDKLIITTDINELISACDIVVLVTPSIYLADTLQKINCDFTNKIFLSAIKGIVPQHNDIVAHYLRDIFKIGFRNQAVLAGPCHAEEVSMGRLSYITIAAAEDETTQMISSLYSSDYIKVSQSKDIIGNEYSAILKNIYAIGAGIANGLGFGDNFQAVYVSNAIRELKIILKSIYEVPRDVNESAYLGDLLVTCYSLFSRNRTLGNLIGKGYTVKSAIQSMNMVAEGYYATKSIYEICQEKNLYTPIINHIYTILYEEKKAYKEFNKLIEKLN